MTYAEKVYQQLVGADVTTDDAFGRDAVAIISAALKRQREACAKIVHALRPSEFWIGQSIVQAARDNTLRDAEDAILNAEIDAPTDSKPIPTGEE